MIELLGVSKRFGDTVAVDGVDLHVRRGELLALLGPSGCGKTTLLRMLAGFERPDAGSISLGGRMVAGSAWVPPERRRVGMVFQDYALFPHLDVARNVGFGLARAARARRVREVLDLVGLTGLETRYPHGLSGGQQQRVALARALAPAPEVLLLDEPWSATDPVLRDAMRDELIAIVRRAGVTVLLVTHDREEAFGVADRVALMQRGRIVQADTAEDTYYRPTTRWVAEFVGAANFVRGCVGPSGVLTPLGCFAAGGCPHGEVDVMVRPEMVELHPCANGCAEVVGREFRGHDVFYRVRLADGTAVCSQRPSNEIVALGARVDVRVHDGPVALFAPGA